jgi:large subunit ribosomal protein L10
MPLIRAQKESLVENLVEELQSSRISLVVAYTQLGMKANESLRTQAFEQQGKIKMVSNNLLRLLLKKLGREMEIPQRTLALAYGFEDEIAAAKTLVAFGKETQSLEILGGWIDGNFFEAAEIKTLAELPGKEQLQAQLVGRLGGLIGSLAYSLNYPVQKFAFVVEAVKNAQGEGKTEASTIEEKPAEEPKAEAVETQEINEEEEAPAASPEEAESPDENKDKEGEKNE